MSSYLEESSGGKSSPLERRDKTLPLCKSQLYYIYTTVLSVMKLTGFWSCQLIGLLRTPCQAS